MFLFDLVKIEKDLKNFEKETTSDGFWNDTENANQIIAKMKRLEKKKNNFYNLESELKNLAELNELLHEENDEELSAQLLKSTKKIQKTIEQLELTLLFKGKFDKNNAIITLHPRSRWNRVSRLG